MSDAGGALERHADRGETLPENNAGYLDPQYWDHRFETEDEYEWFRRCALSNRPLLIPEAQEGNFPSPLTAGSPTLDSNSSRPAPPDLAAAATPRSATSSSGRSARRIAS